MTTIIEQAQQAELALAAGLAFRIRELAHDIHAVVDALINSIQAAGASVVSRPSAIVWRSVAMIGIYTKTAIWSDVFLLNQAIPMNRHT